MRVHDLVPPVMMRRGNVGGNEDRSMPEMHPVMTTSSPFELAALLAKLRRNPEIREKLIQDVIHKRKAGVYLTRQFAEQVAGAIFHHSFVFSPGVALASKDPVARARFVNLVA